MSHPESSGAAAKARAAPRRPLSHKAMWIGGFAVMLAIVVVVLVVRAYFNQFGALAGDSLAERAVWGQLGDFIGGTVNPVIGLLTLVGLAVTVWLQMRQLELTRQALADAEIERAEALDATRRSLDLAQAEYIASHRPQLFVRNIQLKRPERYHAYFKSDVEPTGQFYVENTGGAVAEITDSYCNGICTDADLPMRRPYEGESGNGPLTAGYKLQPGGSAPGLFRVSPWAPSHIGEVNKGTAGWKFFLLGWIEYRDERGRQYRTAFCRRWNATSERFEAVADRDYEHG